MEYEQEESDTINDSLENLSETSSPQSEKNKPVGDIEEKNVKVPGSGLRLSIHTSRMLDTSGNIIPQFSFLDYLY